MSTARYRILRRLGQGGMAEVFEAELTGDLGFSRKFAIKRMLASATLDPDASRRFLDEARIASRLHHAGIVGVVDLGLLDDLPFQVLELVDGTNAQALLRRAGGQLPLEVALAIAGEVAHALEHAHAALDDAGVSLGIVHRDVKPSNVLVAWTGDVKLGDFGIAVARDRTARTEAGVVAGTLGFIAPEQRTRGVIDGRTDVFALGLTLHALITGYTPMQEVATEMRVLAGDPVPLAKSLPDDVRALIAAAVAVRRDDRPSSGELATAIGNTLAPRLTTDTRSFLRDFLAQFRAAPVARAGALDHLLGIEVEPASDPSIEVEVDAEPKIARYHTVAAPRATGELTRPERPKSLDRPPPPRRRLVPIAAAVLGVVAIAALVAWWQIGGHDVPGATVDAGVDALVHTPDALSHSSDARLAPDAVVVVDAAPIIHVDARVVVHRRPDAAGSVDAAIPTGTGWVQILAGEDMIGAAVYIDGSYVGSVPNSFEVRRGAHRIEVTHRDGRRLGPVSVDVQPLHTRSHPLRPW